MKSFIRNEKGLTLVELLAVFAIGAIVLLFLTSIVTIIQQQYNEQSTQSESLFDVTYAAKVVTKDIRKAETVKVANGDLLLDESIVYHYNGQTKSIEKNGVPFVSDIKDFVAEKNPDNNDQLKITIVSLSNKKVETTITIRKGD